jgi:hypothetical protein
MSSTRSTIGVLSLAVILLGVVLVLISAFYASSFLAIMGLSIAFWGIIVYYIKPDKHVPITLLDASADAGEDNIERILVSLDLKEKGVYLPPKNLTNVESSLIFIPKTPQTPLPTIEEPTKQLFINQENGILITPPGIGLSKLLEQRSGNSFAAADFNSLQSTLPKLLVDNLELAQNIELQMHENTVTVEITGSIFAGNCNVNNQQKTHTQVGCILASALACILAKTIGKPITLQNETQTSNIITIKYRIEDR